MTCEQIYPYLFNFPIKLLPRKQKLTFTWVDILTLYTLSTDINLQSQSFTNVANQSFVFLLSSLSLKRKIYTFQFEF